MLYDTQPAKHMSAYLKKCSEQLEMLSSEYTELRSKFEKIKSQLRSKKSALHDITNENTVLTQRLKAARNQSSLLKCKNASLEEECINFDVGLLSETTDSADSDLDDLVMEPTLQSIIGNSPKLEILQNLHLRLESYIITYWQTKSQFPTYLTLFDMF